MKTSPFQRLLLTISLAISLSQLTGCQGDPAEQRLDNYLHRLSNTLDIEPLTAATGAVITSPPKSLISFPRQTINFLELFDLTDCELHTLIAQRNSSIGKLATYSQRLIYELNFLTLAEQCLPLLRSEQPDLASTLDRVIAIKRQQLPLQIWQATLGATEWKQFWQPPLQLADYPAQTSSEVITALDALSSMIRQWLSGNYQVDGKQLESQLAIIAKGDGGQLLAAWRLLSTKLNPATETLHWLAEHKPLCLPKMNHQRGKVLDTVMRKFFIAEVQDWAARIDQRHYMLMPAVQKLESSLPEALPESYRQWQQQRDRQFAHYRLAPREHAKALHRVLRQCRLAPGG
jgi:hypothetical protein